ncbi:FeoB-associated Cys-rich membrane protein [Salidesulfovibrio onnuriiensis]|nr:FeoB-associated Cys-rich membrane protein [Salidesulfovibrio onnuriiensis]
MDNVLVFIIVAAAVVYVGLRLWRNLSGKKPTSCGCAGCSCKNKDCEE